MDGVPVKVVLLLLAMWLEGSSGSCPVHCQCYIQQNTHTTNCSGQGLRGMPRGWQWQIGAVDVSWNQLQTFDGADDWAANVSVLVANHNQISSLTSTRGMANIHSLDLSWNEIVSLSDLKILQSLPRLAFLQLSNNRITKALPMSMAELQVLLLQNCSLEIISAAFLDAMPKLEQLDVSYNQLKVLAYLKSPSLLQLRSVGTDYRQVDLSGLPQLEIVDFSFNHDLKYISTDRKNTISTILASNCSLESPFWRNMTNLKVLDVSKNNFKELPRYTFEGNTYLVRVNFSMNALKKIDPDAFRGLAQLESIDVSENTLTEINDRAFQHNAKLYYLNMSRNWIGIANGFYSTSLVYLDQSNCEITRISENSLKKMTNLVVLNLAKNLIRKLPEQMESLSLKFLNVRECRINAVNRDTFKNLQNLREINLAGNRLTTGITSDIFPRSLEELYIEDNPWICMCNSDEFRDFYYFVERYGCNRKRLTCQSPASLSGLTWETACTLTWGIPTPPTSKKWLVFACSLFLTGIFCCFGIGIRNTIKERRRIAERAEMQRQRERSLRMLRTPSTYPIDAVRSQRPPSYAEALLMPRIMDESQLPGRPKASQPLTRQASLENSLETASSSRYYGRSNQFRRYSLDNLSSSQMVYTEHSI